MPETQQPQPAEAEQREVTDKRKSEGGTAEQREAAERREALKKKEGIFQPDEAPDEAKKAAELANGAALRGRVKVQKTLTDAKTTANDVMESKEAKKAIEKQLQRTRERDETATETEEGEQTEAVVRRENELEVDTSVQVATGGGGEVDVPQAGGGGLFNVGPERVRIGGNRAPGGPGDGGDAPPDGEGAAPPEEADEPPPADSVLAVARREIGTLSRQLMTLRQQAAQSPEEAEQMKLLTGDLLARLNGAKERMRTAKEELRNRPMTKGEKLKTDIEDAQDVLNDPTASGLDKLGAAVQWIMGYYELWTMGDKRNEMYKPPEGEGGGSGGETPPPSPERVREIAQDKELREEIKAKTVGGLRTEIENMRAAIADKLGGVPGTPGLIEQKATLEEGAGRLRADIERSKGEIVAANGATRPGFEAQLAQKETDLRKNQIDLESVQKQIADAQGEDAKLEKKLERIDKIVKQSEETEETTENGRKSVVERLRILEGDGILEAGEFADLLATPVVFDPNTLEMSSTDPFGSGAGLSQKLKDISNRILKKVPSNEELGIDSAGNVKNPDALMGFMEKLTQKFETNARQEMEKRERIRQSGNEILRGKGLQMRGADTFKLVVNEMTTIYKFENGKWQWSMAENGAFDDVPQNMWPGGGENATKANAIALELSGLK